MPEILRDYNQDLSYDNIIDEFYKSVDFLKLNSNNLELFLNSYEAYKHYGIVRYIFLHYSSFNNDLLNYLKSNDVFKLLCNILNKIVEKYTTLHLDLCNEINYNNYYLHLNTDELKVNFFIITLSLINHLVPLSSDLRFYLVDNGGLKSLLSLLKDHNFVSYFLKFKYYHFGHIIYNINWLSKDSDDNKNIWHELDSINILVNYIRKFDMSKLFVLMALSNVANDQDIENITDFKAAIDTLSYLTWDCINNSNHYLLLEFKNEDDSKLECQVKTLIYQNENVSVSLTGLLLSLYRFSLNNKIKWDLYQKPNLKESLKKIIYEGIDVEKQYALRVLTQLCFDQKVFDDLRKDTKFHEYVEALSKDKNIVYKTLYKTCEQFLWFFNKTSVTTNSINDTKENQKHIMISYNSASRDLCLKIKSHLESLNYKVWIDISEIHGSSVDSMAKAVENSSCFLMCVTEKYRQSLNCQSEAQYAFRLNKHIIPLIMQKGYASVSGWLGFIIGDKIFVDFTKYSLDECLNRLTKQIDFKKKYTETNIQSPLINNSPQIQAKEKVSKNAENWDETKVEIWFNENNLNDLISILRPLNGKGLFQLYQIQVYTPEFFYKSLTKNDKIDIKLLIKFGALLKELFE